MDGVIPVTVKRRASQEQTVHLGVRHLDAKGIFTGIKLGFHPESRRCADASNEVHDRLVIDERTPAPVFGDMAEEAMLDLVPFGRPRWAGPDEEFRVGARLDTACRYAFSLPRLSDAVA